MHDMVIIGNGASGLMAASILASAGREVTVIGRGTPATALSTSCLNITNEGLKRFLFPRLERVGYDLVEGDLKLVTDIGAPCRCLQAHEWMAKANGMEDAVMVRVRGSGQRALVDLGHVRREVTIELPYKGGRATFNSFSRMLRSEEMFGELIDRLRSLGEMEMIMPPILSAGKNDLPRLEREVGVRLAEAVTPMSPQGRRLHKALTEMAISDGARVLEGREAISASTDGKVEIRSGMRIETLEADHLLLATGGLVTRGLVPNGRSTVCGLMPLRVHSTDLPGDVLNIGVETDALGIPTTYDGSRPSNVRCVGELVKGVHGLSQSLLNGWLVARNILEAE